MKYNMNKPVDFLDSYNKEIRYYSEVVKTQDLQQSIIVMVKYINGCI